MGGGGLQFAYVIIKGVRDLLIFADKGGGGIENCKKHAYVIFEQPLYTNSTFLNYRYIFNYQVQWPT